MIKYMQNNNFFQITMIIVYIVLQFHKTDQRGHLSFFTMFVFPFKLANFAIPVNARLLAKHSFKVDRVL